MTPPMAPSSRKAVFCLLLVGLIVTVCYRSSHIDEAPRHPDESNWLHSGYYYTLAKDGQFTHDHWNSFVFYDHPPVAKYIFGLALHIVNGKLIGEYTGLTEWHRICLLDWFKEPLLRRLETREESAERVKVQSLIAYCDTLAASLEPKEEPFLSEGDYAVGRRTAWSFALLSTCLLGILCWKVSGSLVSGLVVPIIFLNGRITATELQLALSDSICCFFVLSALVVLVVLVEDLESSNRLSKRNVIFSMAEGLLLGLALATKFINAYLAVVLVAVFLLSIMIRILASDSVCESLRKIILVRLSSLFLVSASAVAVFVLVNPFLYFSPVKNAIIMAEHRRVVMEIQNMPGVHAGAVHSIGEKVAAIWNKGVLLGYDFAHLPVPLVLFVIIVVLGAIRLGKASATSLSAGRLGPCSIVLIWIALTFAVNGSFLHTDWARYFIPFAMCTCTMFAVGTDVAIARLVESPKQGYHRRASVSANQQNH